MEHDGNRDDLVLALDLTKHGFAFVLFVGPEHPLLWGTKEIHGIHKNLLVVHKIRSIVVRYRPSALVIEDYTEEGSRHVARIQKLTDQWFISRKASMSLCTAVQRAPSAITSRE